jgi:prolyl-tRNA editing enzyme YbaK/EbsC (Cys-tRNA(Pro) deacylase)
MSDLMPTVKTALDSAKAEYEVMACDPSLADTKQFCEHYDIPFANSANAILVKSKKGDPNYTLCVVLATHRLDVNHAVRKKINARKVSFASADETKELTDMEIGGVTPFGLPEELPVLVDSAVMDCEYIILGGGNRASKLKLEPATLNNITSMEVVAELANPISTES